MIVSPGDKYDPHETKSLQKLPNFLGYTGITLFFSMYYFTSSSAQLHKNKSSFPLLLTDVFLSSGLKRIELLMFL